MSKIIFDEAGKHFYENGVSKGVLYPRDASSSKYGPGVAWNGLSSVNESPEGAEETAIYADNIKYLSLRSIEEFKGTIEAYTVPDEFAKCDGSDEFGAPGVKVSQQTRTPFCFTFQSNIGSDAGANLGYKIHIIYGATAAPSERAYETINDSPEAATMSWEFTTVPVVYDGKNIAHIEIDSTKLDAEKLKKIEDILYGTEEADARIIMPDELMELLRDEPVPPVLDHIEASLRDPERKYQVGNEITAADFVVTAFYSDGTSSEVKDAKCDVELPYTFVAEDVASGKTFTFLVEDKQADITVPVGE